MILSGAGGLLPQVAAGGGIRLYFLVFDGFTPPKLSKNVHFYGFLREDGGGSQELDVRSKSGIAPSSSG